EALKWSKETYNHQLFTLSAKDQAEIQNLVKPIIDEYVKKVTAAGLPGDQIMKDVYQLKTKYEKEYKK
ncbi:MAG: C4-dicarboxylate ABC transporter substrate-binding protein, partial [Syntrophorhabdus sp.]